jgi:hypothetical protein
MALVLADRVQETTTTAGTGSLTLAGAVGGFQSFAVVGNGNTCYYTIVDGTSWEVGIGTYSTSGPTLARTTVLSNSSGTTSPLTLSATAKPVFLTYPSEKSVNLDASGNVSPLGTVASGAWQGSTVGVAYGGTGVTSSSGANSVMLRDANQNVSINRLNQNSTTTTAAGGTTTLTAASTFSQILVGTGNQTFKLPDATTLTNTTTFEFNNNATGTLTITDYANATIGQITSGGAAAIALLSNATVGGTWDVHAYIPENVTWGTNALVLGGTVITGGTWNGGTIATGYGGTGLTSYTSGGAVYANSSSTLTSGTLPASAGGTSLTSFTSGGVVYASSTSALATGSALTFDGTNLKLGTVTPSPYSGYSVMTLGQTNGAVFQLSNTAGTNNFEMAVAGGETYLKSITNTPLWFGVGNIERMRLTNTGLSTTVSITSGSSVTIGTGGTYAAGSIYSDASWGMIFRAKQASPSLAQYRWADSADTELARIGLGGSFNTLGAITQNGSQVLTAANYNSYAPTLTGSGASGTWGINITGSAGSAPGYLPLSGGTMTGNIIVSSTSVGAQFGNLSVGFGGAYNTLQTKDGTSELHLQYNSTGNIFLGVGGGYTTINQSARSPIYYDSNDTAYYVNPNASSKLNTLLQLDSYNAYSPNHSYGLQMGDGCAGITAWNFNPGGSSAYRNLTFWGTGYNGSAVVQFDIMTIGNYGGYVGIRTLSPNYELDVNGIGVSNSSFRAPIF